MNNFKASTYSNEKFKSQSMCNDNKTDGFRVQWYESGQIKSASEYKHNKRDGLRTSWYENGHKSAEINHDQGVKNGRLVIWYKDGSKKSEVTYISGRMDGLWVSWYKNGQILKAALFKDKKKISKTTWHSNGRLKSQEDYDSSHRILHELPEVDWDSYPYNQFMDMPFTLDGNPEKISPYSVSKISEKSWYKNGITKSKWAHYGYQIINTGWYENGQLKYNHGHNNTLPKGSMCWHENGQLSYMLDPDTDKYISFDVNGTKEYELEAKYTFEDDDFWREKYIFFDKDANKLCSIEIDDNTLVCLWSFYDKNDNKIYVHYYDYDKDTLKKDKIWQFWINQDIKNLTKILAPVEKHKDLFCTPVFL